MKKAVSLRLVSLIKAGCSPLLLAALISSSAQAQYPPMDCALWINASVQYKINKHFNVHLNQQNRFTHNVTSFNMAYADLGVTYRINKHMKVMTDYVYIQRRRNDQTFGMRSQFYAAFVYKHKLGPFDFSYRNMVQSEVEEGSFNVSKVHKAAFYDRNKVTFVYKLKKHYSVYCAQELFAPFRNGHFTIDRSRSFIGMFYDINKHMQIEPYLAFQTDLNSYTRVDRTLILGLGYSFDF